MVFESLVVDVLNKYVLDRYLKPFVKKLDTSQLKVGVLKGHVRLEKLELKEDLFAKADLDVPIKIKRSYIGTIELNVSWKRLTKDPIDVLIDEVFIVVGPDLHQQYDAETDLRRQRKEKEKRIEKFQESAKKKKQQEKEARKGKKKKDSNDKPDTFAEKLTVHMTKNLNVKVRDIHIRYEDSSTNPHSSMAAGITLHSLELKSTDSSWMPTVVREAATIIFKLIELNNLGLYWNTSDTLLGDMPLTEPEFIRAMRDGIARPACAPPPSNAYLLVPMSATARIKANLKNRADLSVPQLLLGLECEDISFCVKQDQLKALLTTVEAFDKDTLGKKFLRYKPLLPVLEDRQGWWRYAITAVVEEDVKRCTQMWSWKHIKEHRATFKLYQLKYRENPSTALQAELQELEDKLDWLNIVFARKQATKKQKSKPKKGSQQSAAKLHPPASPSSPTQPSLPPPPSQLSLLPHTPPPPPTTTTTTPPHPSPDPERRIVESSKKKEKKKEKKKSGGFFSKFKKKLKPKEAEKQQQQQLTTPPGPAAAVEASGGSASPLPSPTPGKRASKKKKEDKEEEAEREGVPESKQEDKERSEFYNEIGYSEDEEYIEFPKYYVAFEFSVLLNKVTLELISKKRLGTLVTDAVKANVGIRPSANGVCVAASVGGIEMTGISHGPEPTILVTSKVGGPVEATPLVEFKLEVNPLERPEMDMTVKAALKPIQITYDFETVDGLIAMFKPPKLIHFQELTQAASASLDQLKSQTTAGLQSALKNRKQVEVDVTLHSPFLVVPEGGQYSASSSCLLIIDLGRLTLFGSTKDPRALIKAGSTVDSLNKFYDEFTIALEGLQVLTAKPGEDWLVAMATGSSSMHIVEPTGLEIQLLKSIVGNDAYLPSLRVEGALPGFEVGLSDAKLATLLRVVAGLKKPPSLITHTHAYDELPSRVRAKTVYDTASDVVDTISLDTMSVSSFGDDEDEDSVASSPSLSGSALRLLSPMDGEEKEDTSRTVFTDVSLKLTIKQIAVKLSQVEGVEGGELRPLLDVVISNMKADVVDRKWDSQGSVAMGEISILDYITPGEDGGPSYLLKTQGLNDGNFISASFVGITQVGVDFAAKYTGLQDSVTAQLSLIKLQLHRHSVATLLHFFMRLKPSLDSVTAAAEEEETDAGLESIEEEDELEINLRDVEDDLKKPKDFKFDVKFEGIDLSLVQQKHEFLQTTILGFELNGHAKGSATTLSASIDRFLVMDPTGTAQRQQIIYEEVTGKKFLTVDVVQYSWPAHERDSRSLAWVDTSVTAEIHRLRVNLASAFLTNALEFAKHLNLNQDTVQTAAKATAGTATATATAIKDSTKSAHRVKLDVTLHAPLVRLPYTTSSVTGGIFIDLGEFHISNKFSHGPELLASIQQIESINLRVGATVLDCMEIRTSSIQVYREVSPVVCALGGQGECGPTQSTVLEPFEFSAQLIRNISRPNASFPNVHLKLKLDSIKFHVHEEDVKALIVIGLAAAKIGEVMAPPPKKPVAPVVDDKCELKPLPQPPPQIDTARQRSRTRTTSRLKKAQSVLYEDVTELKVEASLDSVSLDITTNDGPLLTASAAGLDSDVKIVKKQLLFTGSVESLSVVDLAPGGCHSQVVSLAGGEHSGKVSSLSLTVALDHDQQDPLAPLGRLQASIAQTQLVVQIPFVLRVAEFAKRCLVGVIDRQVVASATKAAQDGATAVTSLAENKYFRVEVGVHAPVLLLPLGECSAQGLMVDLGSVHIQNTLLVPDHTAGHIGIDAYGFKLDSFKVSRVLLDYDRPGSPVVAERVLLQPFCMLLAVERNLCPYYTSIPVLTVNLTMGELKIYLGQDDLENFVRFGADVGEKVSAWIAKNNPSAVTGAIVEGLMGQEEEPPTPPPASPPSPRPEDAEEVYEKIRVFSSLSQFEFKLFKNEPKLDPSVESSQSFSVMPRQCGLASLQLVTMELKTVVRSNDAVEVHATMRDIALCDEQDREYKNTSNRVIQHYTSNPLKAFTGHIDEPLISLSYLQSFQEHTVLLRAQSLLILSDVSFMSTVANYFQDIVKAALPEKPQSPEDDDDTFEEGGAETPAIVAPPPLPPAKKAPKLPNLKIEGSIKDLRVAIIEDIETPQPQALTLKVSTYLHFKLSESSKQASMNIADLSISTSSYYDLDSITSWVLLPSSMSLTMSGPIDKPAMDINGMVDPISLTISPAVIRLIIHAVNALMPKEEKTVVKPPAQLWKKKGLDESKFWFLLPVRLHRARTATLEKVEEKGENLTLTVEAVEIIFESESTSRSTGHPVLAINATAVVQLFEWTAELRAKADFECEASYYNEQLSLWEPLLEPLEGRDGRHQVWTIAAEVKKSLAASPELIAVDSDVVEPKFSVSLSAAAPLQITLTKTSLQLIKTLVDDCSKEYGRRVEGPNVSVKALTGAPFTIVNKLGHDIILFIQPGGCLKIRDKAEFAKLAYEQSVDLFFKRDIRKRSYASLVLQKNSQLSTINISVGGKYQNLPDIAIDTPGLFYFTLAPKVESAGQKNYGLVVEIAVTGTKKTVTVRSSVQFHNHTMNDVELLMVASQRSADMQPVTILKPDQVYPVPIVSAHCNEYYIRPHGYGFKPEGPPIMWLHKSDATHKSMDFKCRLDDSQDSVCHFIRVNTMEEMYKRSHNLPEENFPHHVFHLHPPLVVQNLLPYTIVLVAMGSSQSLESGKFVHMYDLDLEESPMVTVSVSRVHEQSLQGRFMLSKKPKEYINFATSTSSKIVELSVHTEDIGYLKAAIFSPFWMVNKTGLGLVYKDGSNITRHPQRRQIELFSTKNTKNKIQMAATTENGTDTDWTRVFSLNAVGTSGFFHPHLGEDTYKFGVEIKLSQFTLTKLVVITPYYLLVNETDMMLKGHEIKNPGVLTPIPPGEVVPFWPVYDSNRMVLLAGSGDNCQSTPFDYNKTDFIVLQFENEVVALCVEVQESEAANVITFTPYYPGCVPVQIINHFPDLTLQFSQDTKSPNAIPHSLAPGESVLYTWDDPAGRKFIKWGFLGAKNNNSKSINIAKDALAVFNFKYEQAPGTPDASSRKKSSLAPLTPSSSKPSIGDAWLDVDKSYSESLVDIPTKEESVMGQSASTSSISSLSSVTSRNAGNRYRGFWNSFIDGLQRVLIFTTDDEVNDRIKADNSYSLPLFEASVSLRNVGLSLVDNLKNRELAYIAITQSGVIWQLDKGKRIWKTLSTSIIAILEEAYQNKKIDINQKNFNVNLETMEMFNPIKGKLRRTHHDGVFLKAVISEKDYAIHAKIGYVQIDNQLPFSVYPQVLYPLPPPPTVASATEPKPFVEASLILRKNDQSNVKHFKYVHVLVQKMAVNVDLGFILSIINFFSFMDQQDLQIETEYVKNDIETIEKSLKETLVPELADSLEISRSFFDVLHLAPIKISLSFNVRSAVRNKAEDEITVGDRFLELFLHSIGVILTSVQETEMKFSIFHLEYQPQTGRGLTKLIKKHYTTQLLFQLHTIIFGLDVLGNPVSVVRGVVDGAVDLFYEPFKGSVLGPEEFFEGLGLGLRSFFGAGVVGGITGAGARITGAFGDVFAKLTFDDAFIDKRQQAKAKPPRLGSKLGGFAKNVFEGVTGVVTQPVKGLQKEGAVGLLKGTGKGLVGLFVRPTGGLVDLASGTLGFVTRKTQVGNIEVTEIRPPRFIGREGVVTPYSPAKAIGNALLVVVDEGKYVESDYYFDHVEKSSKPCQILLVTDRRVMVIERNLLTEGWKSVAIAPFFKFAKPVVAKETNVVMDYSSKYKGHKPHFITFKSEELATEVAVIVNRSYTNYLDK